MPTINLPYAEGAVRSYRMAEPVSMPGPTPPYNRIALAAAHVVADPGANIDPWLDTAVDLDATVDYRRYLFSLGLGVAEAMDTAQRGMGLSWPDAQPLIKVSLEAARDFPGVVVASGCGTDHLDPAAGHSLDDVAEAYEEQIAFVESLGGRIILMASRALAACARSAEDYVAVYGQLLRQVREPVIIHWLGDMFDPALRGYWGSADNLSAMETCLAVIEAVPEKVDGVKISLLDKEKEIVMRRRLPAGVRMYTGDDYSYAELIEGDEHGYSDALLGIFDAIAPAAAAALGALAREDRETFHAILKPTVALSRHIFGAPTRFYKTGLVFMAFLNGHQNHFTMVGGQQSARSVPHLAELFRLADGAGLLRDPDLAAFRMRQYLALSGFGEN